MKRFQSMILVIAVALSGCNQAAPGTNASTKTGDSSPPPDDSGTAADHASAFRPQTHEIISPDEVPLLEQINRENERVVNASLPSIVRVTATVPADPHAQIFGDLPFKIPFGPGSSSAPRQNVFSYGSGVIISRDGYIVTNYHVLYSASNIEVQMHDQRTFPARIVASDEPLDVTVLKIQATDLPALPWGDSEKVAVGDQVFAIGNPFNLDDSVTRGIVSAKGRNLPDSSYEDYIQTDAAINAGNSGGALVNIHGELIGLNSAIDSFTRGNEGVGFSIPSNMVRYAVESLIRQGRIVRGYLGVRLPAKIDGGVVEQLGLDSDHGALLSGIQHQGPADLAKLQPVDFITEVDGHKIDGVAALRLIVSELPVGKQVVVNYIRAGSPRSTTVKIAELPKGSDQEFPGQMAADLAREIPPPDPAAIRPTGSGALGGIQVTDLNGTSRQKFGVDDIVTSGVIITGVQTGSLADVRGLLPGDVIEVACPQRGSVQPLTDSGRFTALTQKLKPDQSVVLLIHHGKTSGLQDRLSMFVYLGLPAKAEK
jgi:serine protease Do